MDKLSEQKEQPIFWDDLLEKLEKFGLNPKQIKVDKNGFSRNISFSVYDMEYEIMWFKNQSTLIIPNGGSRSAQYPFRFMFLDETCPCAPGGNKSLAFSYEGKTEKDMMGMPRFPYAVFRIPLEM